MRGDSGKLEMSFRHTICDILLDGGELEKRHGRENDTIF